MIKIASYQLEMIDELMQNEFAALAREGWKEFHQENLSAYSLLDERDLEYLINAAWRSAKNFESEQWEKIFQAIYYMGHVRTIGYSYEFAKEVGSFFLSRDADTAEEWIETFLNLHSNPPPEWLS